MAAIIVQEACVFSCWYSLSCEIAVKQKWHNEVKDDIITNMLMFKKFNFYK